MSASHYDLWIRRGDRVYRGVPYEVLADWIQQGRVIGADKLRRKDAAEWQTVESVPTLAVYLPRAAATSTNDRAEALAPVELGIAVRHKRVQEDDDVDMIPLIDISLVLLIFFMMTATVVVGGPGVDVPETQFATLTSDRSMLWVGVDIGPEKQPIYFLGEGSAVASTEDEKLTLPELIDKLKARLAKRESGQAAIVRIAAHHRLPFETVQSLTAELNKLRPLGLAQIKADVKERSP